MTKFPKRLSPANWPRVRPVATRCHCCAFARALCAAGYQEAINYSFVDSKHLQAVHHDHMVLPLANPLSSDMDVMRTTLLPGLLTSLARNVRRQQARVRLFETGVAFLQGETMNEVEHLAGIATGDALPEQWGEPRPGHGLLRYQGRYRTALRDARRSGHAGI